MTPAHLHRIAPSEGPAEIAGAGEPPLVYDVWPHPGRCARWQVPLLRAALRLTLALRRLDLGERIEFSLGRALGMPRGGENLPAQLDRPQTEQEWRLLDDFLPRGCPRLRAHMVREDVAQWGRWWVRECIRNTVNHGGPP